MSLELLVCWVTGIIVGILLTAVVISVKSAIGTLKIDTTNPEKDLWRLDVHDLDKIAKKKYIILQVDANADLSSQK